MNRILYNFNDDNNDIRHGTVRESFASWKTQRNRGRVVTPLMREIVDLRIASMKNACNIRKARHWDYETGIKTNIKTTIYNTNNEELQLTINDIQVDIKTHPGGETIDKVRVEHPRITTLAGELVDDLSIVKEIIDTMEGVYKTISQDPE